MVMGVLNVMLIFSLTIEAIMKIKKKLDEAIEMLTTLRVNILREEHKNDTIVREALELKLHEVEISICQAYDLLGEEKDKPVEVSDDVIRKTFEGAIENAPAKFKFGHLYKSMLSDAKAYLLNELKKGLPEEAFAKWDYTGLSIYYNNSIRYGDYLGKCMRFIM